MTAMQVGFNLITAYDAATIAIGPNRPWFERLTQFRHLHYVDDVIIKVRLFYCCNLPNFAPFELFRCSWKYSCKAATPNTVFPDIFYLGTC